MLVPIKFYSHHGPYGCLSNFSRHPIVVRGKTWKTVEHFFQAQKFPGTSRETKIRNAATPMEAKKLGNEVWFEGRRTGLRPDWESVKEQVMREGLLAKFQQHLSAQQELLSTGEELLIEDAPKDRYWGCGSDGRGKNRLGHLLMEVRGMLRAQKK